MASWRLVSLLAVWTLVLVLAQCCPEPCSCLDKYSHQFADCAYKDLLLVPVGLPFNVTTLSLSANKIKLLKAKSFINVTQVSWCMQCQGPLLLQVTSLWLAHNEIIINFPWEDLANLTALQLLKMNNNEMIKLPKDSFSTLKDLRSLRINNNRFTTIDCQVQVVFTTRKKIPSLLIIVVVSTFLLALATVPLLGATCCHLLYKYQGKTYKLIMKAAQKNPDQMDKQMVGGDFDPRASFVELEKNFNPSEMEDGEGEDGEDADGEEVEGSMVTESIPGSTSKFEVGSEYSDRLPLGAEAVNISEDGNGNYKEPSR
uniref:Immunoglobulin superfamily containing leucine-rich repeat 2 n=1 Tax=Oncorhynchus mykiss TaxID=8022 RepID=A0A8K9XM63_ONCMY